tara:strand:+ start:1030 stop:1317 length:288 start_codon:yes stop_codon:yes gene_type:complete
MSVKKTVEKYKDNDWEVIRAIRFCWDLGIKYYPVVISGQSHKWNFRPRVKIAKKEGSKPERLGVMEFEQDDKLYNKIRELYLNRYFEIVNKKGCG